MNRLTEVTHTCGDAQKPGNAVLIGFGMGHLRPFLHARTHLIGRNVLLYHHAGFAPATGYREGIGKILANLDRVLALAHGVGEYVDSAFRLTRRQHRIASTCAVSPPGCAAAGGGAISVRASGSMTSSRGVGER